MTENHEIPTYSHLSTKKEKGSEKERKGYGYYTLKFTNIGLDLGSISGYSVFCSRNVCIKLYLVSSYR